MSDEGTISAIQALGREILPKGSRLLLYGSRARGTARPDSDWDLLLLLDKDKIAWSDFGVFSYPFIELGIAQGQLFTPHMYTQKQWEKMSYLPYYKNVEQDKIELL
ncbi:MAG: nucleotidyltransferase domain-containing protein [Paludibacteraceae bacterium]|nr:nucleotidyltransferase domain-containing protein [Paludibacteraceae bacterium]